MLDPVSFFAEWATGVLTVLPWVAYVIAAAIGLVLLLLGLRKGLQLFFSIVQGAGEPEFGTAQKAAIDGYGQEGFALMTSGKGFGYTDEERTKWFNVYIEERAAGQTMKGAKNDAHLAVELK